LFEICRTAKEQGYPFEKIFVSHQDLKRMEWPGTKALVQKQADLFGLQTMYSHRLTKEGKAETLLEYVIRRGKWPSRNQRWCTSDFKRGPGARIVTQLTKEMGNCRVLHVFGFRADESPDRAKKEPFKVNVQLTTKKRKVFDYLPIHDWTVEKVWDTIKSNSLPYHYAYDLGMPRLSCCFCIFSPFDALVVAGRANPDLLDEYIAAEQITGHSFKDGFSIASVKKAIEEGYQPNNISNWIM